MFPRLLRNRVSYAGAAIALLALLSFVFLLVFHTLTQTGHAPYAGLVIFILVPAVLLFGLFLIPVGMAIEWRRWRAGGERPAPRFPVIDLNDRRHLNAALVFVVGSVFLLFLTAFGSYEAYEYTESVPFCGTLCHRVMRPEYTTYLNSPHERVACVACHVGPGADWFVKSKLSGLYQVYAVVFHKYPSPIPTPIHNLRPSVETCEQCHWPGQFFGGKAQRFVHFLADEANTRWDIDMIIRIGGGHAAGGPSGGIHWHMNVGNRVEYVATDPQRQKIPWVRLTRLDTGETTTYESQSGSGPGRGELRRMDCMDCHNRPTHIFRSPSDAIDRALGTGRIDPSLPFVKRTGIDLLAAKYPSTEAAIAAIGSGLGRFYAEKYPAVPREKAAAIAAAAAVLQEIYRQNFFPDLHARWDAHADNVGHLLFPGCFRCHDGLHRSADGKVIRNDCAACHEIIAQGPAGKEAFATVARGLEFQHPVDVGTGWREQKCSDCHTGEAP